MVGYHRCIHGEGGKGYTEPLGWGRRNAGTTGVLRHRRTAPPQVNPKDAVPSGSKNSAGNGLCYQ